MWVALLEMAEKWGQAPWDVEQQLPAIWFQRYLALSEEQAELAKAQQRKARAKAKAR